MRGESTPETPPSGPLPLAGEGKPDAEVRRNCFEMGCIRCRNRVDTSATWRHQLKSVAMPNRRHLGTKVLRALEAKGGHPCERNVGVRQRDRLDPRVVRACHGKRKGPLVSQPRSPWYRFAVLFHGPILLNKRPPFIPGRNLRPTSRRQNVACLRTTGVEGSYSVTGGDARSFCWVSLARQGWAESAADGHRPQAAR